MAYPSEQAATEAVDAVQPPTKARLVTLQSVSVYIHEDGSVHAFHSRLDTQQYKVISTRLADQYAERPNNLFAALALIAAACEVYEDEGGVEGYTR